jgi:hypothetical protein
VFAGRKQKTLKAPPPQQNPYMKRSSQMHKVKRAFPKLSHSFPSRANSFQSVYREQRIPCVLIYGKLIGKRALLRFVAFQLCIIFEQSGPQGRCAFIEIC